MVTFPYTLAYFYDKLHIATGQMTIQRNDQFSGMGGGQFWQAELAPPLWTIEPTLGALIQREAVSINAIIRALDGGQQSFYFCDPAALYPAYDPTGSILGSSAPKVSSLGSGLHSIAISGLPANYKLTAGDKLQINSTGGKTSFHEVGEDITAAGTGITGQVRLTPAVPVNVLVNDAIILKKPAALMRIYPESHTPGTNDGVNTVGIGFKAIQRKN